MSNALVLPEGTTPAKFFTEDAFNEFASARFLPRLQLYSGNSGAVQQGKMNVGHYGVQSNKTITPLGDTVELYILGVRLKALKITEEEVQSCFDPNDPLFKEISAQSEIQDSSCLAGPEFLVYIPSIERFATFFMSSKTMRREAPNVRALMNKPAVLKAELIQTKKYKWHGPIVLPCSVPLEPPKDQAEFVRILNSFNSPEANEVAKNDGEGNPVPETTRER